MAAAPLAVEDKVIVLPGGPAGKSVAAYDRLTGVPVWKALDDKTSYTSPLLVTLAGKRQLLIVTAKRMVRVAVEDGACFGSIRRPPSTMSTRRSRWSSARIAYSSRQEQ